MSYNKFLYHKITFFFVFWSFPPSTFESIKITIRSSCAYEKNTHFDDCLKHVHKDITISSVINTKNNKAKHSWKILAYTRHTLTVQLTICLLNLLGGEYGRNLNKIWFTIEQNWLRFLWLLLRNNVVTMM